MNHNHNHKKATTMKTKKISPGSLRPGMRIVLETVPRDVCRDGSPRSYEVRSVYKARSPFTGCEVWRICYNDPASTLGYGHTYWQGAGRRHHPRIAPTPAEKVTVEIC